MTSQFVKVTFYCAVCGTPRQEANHWFVVVTADSERLRRIAEEYGRQPPSLAQAVLSYCGGEVRYWLTNFEPTRNSLLDSEFPVCGESCLNKLTSKILSEKKPCAA